MNELISIIVPVYNVEPYIHKCVDSILAQTYKNIEVILVDDGSPDRCGEICDEYALKDPRVKVIHKSNGGLSDARNAGLDIMQGRYVGFVDSDDWIAPTMYEKLQANLFKFDADMSFGGVADDLVKENSVTTVKTSEYGTEPFSESNVEAMKRYFLGSWAAWDKLYKSELFEDIRYPVGEINEDEAIVLNLLSKCTRVCYTDEVFYHYMKRENSGSITTSSFSKKKLVWPEHCKANLRFIQEKYPQLEYAAAARYRGSLMWALTEIAMLENKSEFSNDIIYMRSELRKHFRLFVRAGFKYKREIIRYFVLLTSFSVYRVSLKTKRRIL